MPCRCMNSQLSQIFIELLIFNVQRIHEQRKLGRTTEILIEGKPTTISYDDLEKKKLLGRGQYGIVNKVCHTPTGKILAAKVTLCFF
jgi:hypothetical protein